MQDVLFKIDSQQQNNLNNIWFLAASEIQSNQVVCINKYGYYSNFSSLQNTAKPVYKGCLRQP